MTAPTSTAAPTWNLSLAYHGLTDPQITRDITEIEQGIAALTQLDPSNIEHLQQALLKAQAIDVTLQTLSSFANCITSVDASNEPAKALDVKMDGLYSQLQQQFSPIQHALIHGSDEQLAQVLAGNEQTGSLAHFAFQYQRERLKQATSLSVKEEQLLSAMQVNGRNAWSRLYDNLTGSIQVTLTLPDGSQETMGLSQAASILYGSDTLRHEAAWRAINQAMTQHQQSFAAILNALAGDRLTEYAKRSDVAVSKGQAPVHFLDPSLFDSRIEAQTLATMISVTKNNRALGQRAGKLMAQCYGQTCLKPWQELAGMPAAAGDVAQEYSFEQAITIIKQAFAGIDPEMAEFVDYMVENQLIDAAPAPNKRMGAYCTQFENSRTPLVFMTWGNSMSDVITLAHELGHAFHNWVLKDQPLALANYPMTLAETASIFAENVVRSALMEQATDKQAKLQMLWEEAQSALALLNNIPVRFEFEQAFYTQRSQGELSPTQLSQLMSDTWADWYGDAMDETNPMFWASKLHFSIGSVSFYNYPYLFGYLFSKGVYAQRAAKGSAFYADYKALLADTGAMTAEDLVQKHLGMDIRQADFWQQSLDLIAQDIEQFAQTMEQ